jgi:hypothetical protein
MKKDKRKSQMNLQVLKPEEMLLIRAGDKKPKDPDSPDEGIMLI